MSNVFPPFEPERGEKRPRRLGFAGRQVPIRVLIPNIFTLVGLCAGLTAIRMAIEHRFDLAVAALVLAAILDALDGRVARLLKASSRFGAELDSLADFVNFGVAPAIIIFTWALDDQKSFGWIVVMIFALCAALRLARFNVAIDGPDQPQWKSAYFIGVPAPMGAIIVLLPLYLQSVGLPVAVMPAPIIMGYTLAIAFLMVSRFPTYSGKLFGQRIAREYVLPIFMMAALFAAVLLTYPYMTMTALAMAYLATIPLSVVTYHREERKAEETAKSQNGSKRKSAEAPPAAPPMP